MGARGMTCCVSMREPGGADHGAQESAFEPQATDPVAYGASAPSSVRVMTDLRPEAFPEQTPCWGRAATEE